jgi:hypothetical protein
VSRRGLSGTTLQLHRQNEALEANPSIIYTCGEYRKVKEVLYPVLDRCPHGDVYESYSCKERESTTATESGSTGQTKGTMYHIWIIN